MERNGLGKNLLKTARKLLQRQISRVIEVKTAVVISLITNADQIANPNPVSTQFRCLYKWGLMIMCLDNWEARDKTSPLCGILSLLSPCQLIPGEAGEHSVMKEPQIACRSPPLEKS